MGEEDHEFRKKLEALGIEEVRWLRAKGSYGEPKRPLVDEWMASQERKRSEEALERSLSLRSEEISIARSAKKAAIAAAAAAIVAAIAAIVGIII